MINENYKSGFVAVIGRPNVGKSTLMNNLIGQKVAIMSDKPQTTRNKIMGVLTQEDAQILFIDTPGIHKPKHKLGEYMVREAEGSLREVEVILFVVDATEEIGPGERYILDNLGSTRTPVILTVNKIDKIDKAKLLPIIEKYTSQFNFAAVVPISALDHTNFENLVGEIKKYLEPGPQYYPEDMITDQPERLVIAELIREKVLHLTKEEIPHAILVDIEEITTRPNDDLYVRAVIYVERDSQKGIVIGAGGRLLKDIGRLARADIENLLGSKVYLDLWVKVKKDWRNKANVLKSFGFE
ncbi:MAG: era [Firmicutes bacterium]|nr:era [Bacillota bacterium]